MKKIKILYVLFDSNHPFIMDDAKRFLNLGQALTINAAILDFDLEFSLLSWQQAAVFDNPLFKINYQLMAGSFDEPWNIPAAKLIEILNQIDVVYLNQCFSYAGFYIAAQARLLEKCVIGALLHADDQNVSDHYEVNYLFDFFHTYSNSHANLFKNLENIKIIPESAESDLESFSKELFTQIAVCVNENNANY